MTPPVRGLSLAPGLPSRLLSDRRTLSNPARGVSLPRKVKKPHIYLSHEQVRALAAASKYPGLVLVLAYCGIRWGEATALRVKHLDMLRRRLMIEENAVQVGSVIEVGTPKNHKKRTVPFPRFLGEYLARQCEGKARSLVWAKQKAPASLVNKGKQGPRCVAVTVGFEPTLALTPNNISSVAPSAARTRHQPD